MLTKDRVGGALAIVAAIIGLVLVFSTHESKAGDDDDAKPGTAPPTSQVQQAPAPAAPAPAVGPGVGQSPAQPAQPAPVQPAPPAAPAQPAPAPKKDDDGDNDGD